MHYGWVAALWDRPARVLNLDPERVPADVGERERFTSKDSWGGEERQAPNLGSQLGGESG